LRLLLDSHALLWALYEPERLPLRVQQAIAEDRNELFVSLATVWELANKAAVHRLPLAGSSVEAMVERIEQLGVTFLSITQPNIVAAATLPHHHADPFDRMLIAQAQAHSLHLLTKDTEIAKYEVEILWR
jgi:PIN domain nuclease of toxin-antitoxin system